MLKVLQVPFCFYPDPVGGTEVYVETLSQHLQKQGLKVVIGAPGEQNAVYQHKGLQVRRFQVKQKVNDPSQLYGKGDPQAAQQFAAILDKECPDFVHLHALTRGVSLRLVQEAKKRGIHCLFTYHTPTVSCQRGTLMRWGTEVCDGVLDVDTCTRCTLHGLGVARAVTDLVGRVPVGVGKALNAIKLSGGHWTALRMRSLVQKRHRAIRNLFAEVDHIIAVSHWVKDLLQQNNVPPKKITVSHHGLPWEHSWSNRDRTVCPSPPPPLEVAYLGRLDSPKGVHVLIQAVKAVPDLDVDLHIYGVSQSKSGEEYFSKLKALAAGDPRIVFRSPIMSNQVIHHLQNYHVLAVPSQQLETGPLVVLEAFAAGIPVLGSNLGGISERVKDEVDGLLVEPGSVEAWAKKLSTLSKNKDYLAKLRAGVCPPRTMEDVAEEMAVQYHNLI